MEMSALFAAHTVAVAGQIALILLGLSMSYAWRIFALNELQGR